MVQDTPEFSPSRRSVVAGTAASLLAASSMNASAQQTKGPAVWLGLAQRELDDAYDHIKYAPNLPQIVGRYKTNSDVTRTRIGAPKRLKYGAPDIEGVDLYATRTPNAPVQVFIHGGAWRAGLADQY